MTTDIDLAQRAIRVHCPVRWPEGMRCNNCGASHPCFVYQWGYSLLEQLGWDNERIVALDARTGPWS